MAGNIPIPRSYQSILGDIISAFLSRFGIQGLKVGGPLLSILESAAQSDVKNTQDIFDMLDSTSVDQAVGIALQRIGNSENVLKQGPTTASGIITVSDSSIVKIASKVYPGAPAPIAGTLTLKISDASKFPSIGQVYIGRSTVNYEGPISYSSPTSFSSYWTITLGSPTQRFHDVNETVIIAQGGNRPINAGQSVGTQSGILTTAVTYTTTLAVTLLDGETSISGVPIICTSPGSIGNVQVGAINQFIGLPFTGATVTNVSPIVNGIPSENDDTYRERIKNVTQSRSKGTPIAITTNAIGTTSKDENKTVVSASVLQPENAPTTLFIDDGTGYEEIDFGIPTETLVDSALGGEQYFQVAAPKPVAKAFAISSLTAPFIFTTGSQLAVLTGSILSTHTFQSTDFRSISNATAFEVVKSINSDPNILFSARTANSGSQVVVFARADTNEDVQVVPPTGIDANISLGFSAGDNFTMRLYLNDQLLFKDGQLAEVTSNLQSSWGSISSGATLTVAIDNTPAVTYTFNDIDFVNANTGFLTVSQTNSLVSWAAVFNTKIPGITAVANGSELVLTSNKGANSSASIVLGPTGTLISSGMFTASGLGTLIATGKTSDYTLNRNTGQIKLANPLSPGDKLVIGSLFTRAYAQSSSDITNGTLTINNNGANIWLVVDGAASKISSSISASTTFTITNLGNNRTRYTAGTNNIFNNVLRGDWAILWDPNLTDQGYWRVSDIDTVNFAWIELEQDQNPPYVPSFVSGNTFTQLGVAFVRTTGILQQVRIAGGTNRTLLSIVSDINSRLNGALASVFRNLRVRITTNTIGSNGDILIVTADTEGQKLLLPLGKLFTNLNSHLASVESQHGEIGTPTFGFGKLSALSTGIGFTSTPAASSVPISSGLLLGWARRMPGATWETYGRNVGRHSALISVNSGVITPRPINNQLTLIAGTLSRVGTTVTATSASHGMMVGDAIRVWPGEINFPAGIKLVTSATTNTFTYSEAGAAVPNLTSENIIQTQEYLPNDRFWASYPYSISPDDTLNVVIDEDLIVKDYSISMGRRIKPFGAAVYAQSGFRILDVDNSNLDPSVAFGVTNPNFFQDYALFMHGRGKSHSVVTSTTILWRWARLGLEGNNVRVAYINPVGATQPFALQTQNNGANALVNIQLPSGSLIGGLSLTNSTGFYVKVNVGSPTVNADSVQYNYARLSIAVGALSRSVGNVVTATITTTPDITGHGYSPGQVVYLTSTDANFPSGPKTIVTTPSATQFTYNEAGANVVSVAITTVSSSSVDPNFAAVVIGDILNVTATSGFPSIHVGAWRVTAKSATTVTVIRSTGLVMPITVPVLINNTSAFTFYPIDTAQTVVSNIVNWVNTNISSLITATAVSDNGGGPPGTGTVTTATLDEFLLGTNNASGPTSVSQWPLFDGEAFIQSSNLSVASTIALKDPVTADLTIFSDFSNEDMRLVPISVPTLVSYLNSPAVSGLFSHSEIITSSRGEKLQLTSSTLGSLGSMHVTGGTANALSAAVIGGASTISTYTVTTIAATQAIGLIGDSWVAAQATNIMPKTTPWTSANHMAIGAPSLGNALITFDITVTTRRQLITNTSEVLRIQKTGRFVGYTLNTSALSGSILEGDWVIVTLTGATVVNTGTFRVVRVDLAGGGYDTFWIENPNAVTESTTIGINDSLAFYSYDSVMPGDTFVISTSDFGTANVGSFIVSPSGFGPSSFSFNVLSSTMTINSSALLGIDAPFVTVLESSPIRLIKQLHAVNRNNSNSNYLDISFNTSALSSKISSIAGTLIQPLDKLDFNTTLVSGADGYSYAGGLIGEVNRIEYGDQSNPSVYPGVIAAGAYVNISNPLVKRIQVSLVLRLRTGAVEADVKSRVQSIVASNINKVPMGTSISLASIVSAAQSIDGVFSAAILSPTFGPGNDLIPVQANEKPRVLDATQDILVSTV